MSNYPVWNEMTAAQKFEFLHEWLMNVEGAIKSLRADIRGLHERLQQAELAGSQMPNR
jgi:hypothetical protein